MVEEFRPQSALNHQQAVLLSGDTDGSPGNQRDLLVVDRQDEPGASGQTVSTPGFLGNDQAAGCVDGNFFFHNAILSCHLFTIGEIRRGVDNIRRRDPHAAASLDGWLLRLQAENVDRILPVDRAAAEEWGRLNVPDPIPVIDGLLAATAKVRGLTLVTRNTRDVERTGVDLLNPFDEMSAASS